MKRLALLVASVVALVLFTACPDNKPTDEPVVIPDGTYEETAHYMVYKTYDDTQVLAKDTFISAIVDITDKYFVYRDMCRDTYVYVFPSETIVAYKPHFVYLEHAYCHECQATRYPAQVTEDGYVLVKDPDFAFGYALTDFLYKDSSYQREFRIFKNGEAYQFEQEHDFSANYRISHTLIPLSDQ